ncbi:MAG: hypothetical protein HY056_09380 [Proteobacteria bacterium]|nr:hypothetical protein [Pseudomonadota bacterium]
MKFAKLAQCYRIDKPDRFRLQAFDPTETCGLDIGKDEAKVMLANGVAQLSALQEQLYAQNRWAVLAVFQAMDAAGKDGVIKHVMSGVNPQGCQVHSFKAPSAEELDHDFLWRVARRLPERGRIGIFNRSHYEEVLVVRVHPEFLERQRLPEGLAGKDLWKRRFKSIRGFERHLAANGVLVLKGQARAGISAHQGAGADRDGKGARGAGGRGAFGAAPGTPGQGALAYLAAKREPARRGTGAGSARRPILHRLRPTADGDDAGARDLHQAERDHQRNELLDLA